MALTLKDAHGVSDEQQVDRFVQSARHLPRKTQHQIVAMLCDLTGIVTVREWKERILPRIEEKKRKEAAKLERIAKVRAERARKEQTEPVRILQAFYQTLNNESENLSAYEKCTTKELVGLLNLVSSHDPDLDIHRKVKPPLIQWLKNRIVASSVEKHNEPVFKTLKDTLRIRGQVKRESSKVQQHIPKPHIIQSPKDMITGEKHEL